MNYKNVTVIIPALNEESNISAIISQIRKSYKNIRIIVADGGSADNTLKIVRKIKNAGKNVRLLENTGKGIKGLTASVIDGVRCAEGKYIIVMDADLQHPPETIKDIVEKLKENDLVVACRKKLPKEWPLTRRLISKTAVLLGRIRLAKKRFKVSDVVSGFFGVRTELIKNVLDKNEERFEKQGYKILFELLKYCPADAKVSQVYYDFRLRKSGSSKINKKHVWIYFKSLFK